MNKSITSSNTTLVLFLFISLLGTVIIRSAWISDDAYITFRTVDNFIHGYGLTWNTNERVQAYTHPLWMFLMSGFYFFTQEIYYTCLIVSFSLSMLTASLLAFKVAKSFAGALFVLLSLSFSRAYVDYSTSGLENALTHLLIILFLIVYINYQPKLGHLFCLSFIASLAMLNRIDIFLIFGPALLYRLWRSRSWTPFWKGSVVLGLGTTPVIMWELFSLFYYGFPFPNTAYAKLNTGIERSELIGQGFLYLLDSINHDPLTLFLIGGAIVTSFITLAWQIIPISIGIILYIAYTVWIGGDFMSGRFLTAPLIASVAMLACYRFGPLTKVWPAFGVIVLLSFAASSPTLLDKVDYERFSDSLEPPGIVDERGFYYKDTGLLNVNRYVKLPRKWRNHAKEYRTNRIGYYRQSSVGISGYSIGPDVHLVDRFALTDPLLARLPSVQNPKWRPGHFLRLIPSGYVETVLSGQNQIHDQDLARYYDKLSMIVKGDIYNWDRLTEIWKLNLGYYDDLINWQAYRYPGRVNTTLTEFNDIQFLADNNNLTFDRSGISINLTEQFFTTSLQVGLSPNDDYQLIYYRGEQRLGAQILPAHSYYVHPSLTSIHQVKVPKHIVRKGYDQVVILPLQTQAEGPNLLWLFTPYHFGEWQARPNVNFQPDMSLVRYAYSGVYTDTSKYPSHSLRVNELLMVVLQWRKINNLYDEDLKVSLRLKDDQHNNLLQVDKYLERISPFELQNSLYWALNDMSSTFFFLKLPPDLSPGSYTLAVLVYGAESMATLDVQGQTEYVLGSLEIN